MTTYVKNTDPDITIPVTGPKVGENVPLPVHGWIVGGATTVPCVVIDGLLVPLGNE